ncbi:hypothetical protein [Eubacterium limosum]|uniref:gp53-like domain-containing protein n=1 Tax=Eubacterium limosum TaxID=1736 RepID=UPI00371B57F7
MTVRKADYLFKNGPVWDQLLFSTAEDQIKSGWTQNLGANGYRKLPGGLILQWIKASVPHTPSTVRPTWPIAFPNAALAFAIGSLTAGRVAENIITADFARNGLTLSQDWVDVAQDTYIIAIGY